LGEPPEYIDLRGDELTHCRRQPLGHVVHRSLLAMHDSEAVADEGIGQSGQPIRDLAADRVVLAGLAGVEADVLQHRDPAVPQRPDGDAGALA
jgi:hypothetical protein